MALINSGNLMAPHKGWWDAAVPLPSPNADVLSSHV